MRPDLRKVLFGELIQTSATAIGSGVQPFLEDMQQGARRLSRRPAGDAPFGGEFPRRGDEGQAFQHALGRAVERIGLR